MDSPRSRFVLTACSKCCGDLALERDRWGERYVCFQCGNEEVGPEWSPHLLTEATRPRVQAGHRQLGS